ncbi:MAG: hypothetical protein ND895_28720 [Pyrinomonadaceae bacterium]|nr:hypothetical protein [Pyrinomonadaceae bacterium]
MKKTRPQLLVLTLLLLTISAAAPAQNTQPLALSGTVRTDSNSALTQTIPAALAALPEADTLIFINSRRILSEAAPRLMPEKDLADMRKGFDDMKQMSGVDPSSVDYIVIAVRFRKPSAELTFMPPEFMALASGDFNSESLMGLARMASDGKLRDEKYGMKTLGLMTIDPIAKEAEKNPLLKSFSEVAVVPLNATTIAIGSTAYLKAAIDAEEGNKRISSESLNSLLRDPSALISIAGSPLTSFSKTFALLGTEANPRAPRCDSKFGDFYAAVTMDAANFTLRGALNADNPDTAHIVNNLINGLLRYASASVPDPSAQSLLKTLSITPQDNEVVLRADLPQQMVIDMIKEQMKPKKKEEASSPVEPTKEPTVKKRVVRRRSKKSTKP